MSENSGRFGRRVFSFALAVCSIVLIFRESAAQEMRILPANPNAADSRSPAIPPSVPDENQPLRINLPTAMHLANVRALDISLATQRLNVAVGQLKQANVLWLPTITLGGDYYRHDGTIQAVAGDISTPSKSSLMFGIGSGIGNSAVICIDDAIFAPLAARQVVAARKANIQAASNDALLQVTEAYLTVQQARGELAGAAEVSRFAIELADRIGKLAEGLVPPLEGVRARAELMRRQQAESFARQRWRLASADLINVLALDPRAQVEPMEPPQLRIVMFDPNSSLDDLLALAQMHRPELAAQQSLIVAAEMQVRQEKFRPLLPNLVVRGASTNPAGTLGAGVFGGGINSTLGSFGGNFAYDVQLLWQLDNLGLGNLARVKQRQAETRAAGVELSQLHNRVAAEVSRAHAELRLATQRIELAEKGLKLAQESLRMNLAGVQQTRRIGNTVTLIVRPQEAVAAIQSLAQAYLDYYGAIAESNRAGFRLYRAVGQPAQSLLCHTTPPPEQPAGYLPPASPATNPATLPMPGKVSP